jgi:hypothetical protein
MIGHFDFEDELVFSMDGIFEVQLDMLQFFSQHSVQVPCSSNQNAMALRVGGLLQSKELVQAWFGSIQAYEKHPIHQERP